MTVNAVEVAVAVALLLVTIPIIIPNYSNLTI